MRWAKHERNCWWEVGYTWHGPSTERRFPDMWTSYWNQLGALRRALHTTPHATLKYMYGSGDLRASGILRCTGGSSLSLNVIKSGVFSRMQKKVTELDDSFTCTKIALQISLLACDFTQGLVQIFDLHPNWIPFPSQHILNMQSTVLTLSLTSDRWDHSVTPNNLLKSSPNIFKFYISVKYHMLDSLWVFLRSENDILLYV